MAIAYTIVPDPTRRGRYHAVRLYGVMFESMDRIAPGGVSEPPGSAINRVEADMQIRNRRRQWNG